MITAVSGSITTSPTGTRGIGTHSAIARFSARAIIPSTVMMTGLPGWACSIRACEAEHARQGVGVGIDVRDHDDPREGGEGRQQSFRAILSRQGRLPSRFRPSSRSHPRLGSRSLRRRAERPDSPTVETRVTSLRQAAPSPPVRLGNATSHPRLNAIRVPRRAAAAVPASVRLRLFAKPHPLVFRAGSLQRGGLDDPGRLGFRTIDEGDQEAIPSASTTTLSRDRTAVQAVEPRLLARARRRARR